MALYTGAGIVGGMLLCLKPDVSAKISKLFFVCLFSSHCLIWSYNENKQNMALYTGAGIVGSMPQ